HQLAQCWIRGQMQRWHRLTVVLQLLVFQTYNVIGDDDLRWPLQLALHNRQFKGVEGNALQGAVAEGFTVQVGIGTPPQQLALFVDTGSSDVAVASYPERNLTTFFDTNKSSTYNSNGEQVSKNFVEGSYSGAVGSDVLQDQAGDVALRISLVAISSSTDMFPNHSHWQGLLGLAFPALSKQTSFMQVLNEQKGIKRFELSPCTKEETGTVHRTAILFGFGQSSAHTELVERGLAKIRRLSAQARRARMDRTNMATTTNATDDSSGSARRFVWYPHSQGDLGSYNLSRDAQTLYCLEDGFVALGFPDIHLHFPDLSGKVFQLELTPEASPLDILTAAPFCTDPAFDRSPCFHLSRQVYFQRVKVETGDKGCYRLGIGASGLGTVIGFNVLRRLNTVFDLENKRVGFSGFDCSKGGVGVTYTNYSYTGHSCAWDFVTMEDNAWTILLYVLIFIVVMCAIPTMVILLIWTRKKIRIYRARCATEGVSLVDF
ncbi:unnamed protein product, partial [Ixodes hexagonus]